MLDFYLNVWYNGNMTIEKTKKMATNFLVVLSDGETYDFGGTLVRVTDDQLEEIESGEKVYNIVDLSDVSDASFPLNEHTLPELLPEPDENETEFLLKMSEEWRKVKEKNT
jgi:hypothetical protein